MTEISRRTFLGGLTALAAGAAVTSACGSNRSNTNAKEPAGGATGGGSGGPATLNAGHLVGGCMAPLFLADAKGLFAEQNLTVKLSFFGNPGDNLSSLVAGANDVVHNPFSNTFVGKEKGEDLVIVSGSGKAGLELVARAGSGVATLDDLAAKKRTGLKLGTLRVDTLELTVFHLLQSKGLTYEDFQMVFFNDLLAMGQALINKDVDVCTVVQPYAALVVQEAKGSYLGNNETAWGTDAPDCVVTMKRSLLDKKPDVVERYLKAILAANDLMDRDFEGATATLAKGRYFKVEGDALGAGLKRQPPQVRLSKAALAALDKGVEDMRALGYVKKVKSSDLIDLSILSKVA